MNKVRIYKDIVNKWDVYDEVKGRMVTTQYEVSFAEYYTDGTFYRIGTEDFSADRYNKQVRLGWVYTWNGTRRNRGGNRWFDFQGSVQYLKGQAKDVKEFLKTRFPGAEVIDIRTH